MAPATIPAKMLVAPMSEAKPAMMGLISMELIKKKKLAASTRMTSLVYKRVFTQTQFLSKLLRVRDNWVKRCCSRGVKSVSNFWRVCQMGWYLSGFVCHG